MDYPQPIEKRKRLDELLQCELGAKHEKSIAFKNRISDHRQYLFQFLYHYDVPPDNNASERAVRTFRVKQKVSGLSRSGQGAKTFAVICSLIDTTIKNGHNVAFALKTVPVVAE